MDTQGCGQQTRGEPSTGWVPPLGSAQGSALGPPALEGEGTGEDL